MPFLKKLKEKLYRPQKEIGERPREPDFKTEEISPAEEQWKETPLADKQKKETRRKVFKITSLVVLVLIILFVLAITVFRDSPLVRQLIFREIFKAREVSLKIEGEKEVKSGQETTYLIKYSNLGKVALEQIELTLERPEGFSLTWPEAEREDYRVATWSLSDLAPKSEDSFEIKGTFIGQQDESKTLKVKLRYIPANFQSYFETSASLSVTISSVPLVLNLNAAKEIISGRRIGYLLDYLNASQATFSNVRIVFEYPQGFTFSSAQPEPTEANNIWDIGQMIPDQLGQIKVEGTLEGKEGENKSLTATIGLVEGSKFIQYNKTVVGTEIVASPLYINQRVNDEEDYLAKAGDVLEYEIKYENRTNQEIRDVVITSQLSGQVLDFDSIEVENGVFDKSSKTISWSKDSLSTLGLLKSNQGGTLNFTVKVKDYLPIDDFGDKNFTINSLVRMSGANVPDWVGLSENELITKVSSRLVLNARGYYYDPIISNSGPIPPKVGQTTTYTIHWQLLNLANDVEGVEIKSTLPSNVDWTNQFTALKGELSYDSRLREISWQIDKLAANTGILTPVQEAIFQISITPIASQIGKNVLLLEESTINGTDTFTQGKLTNTAQEVTTALPDDPSIGRDQGKVVQ